MSRNNTNNAITQNYIETIKTHIENNEFEDALLILIILTQVKNITRDQIKQKVIDRIGGNEAYNLFDNYHMGQLSQQEINRRLLEIRRRHTEFRNSSSNSNTDSPYRKLPSNKNKNKKKKQELPKTKKKISGLINSLSNFNTDSPNKRLSNKNRKSGLPVIRRITSGLINSLPRPKNPNKRLSNKNRKSGLPVIRRRPTLKRRKSSSGKGKKPNNKKK